MSHTFPEPKLHTAAVFDGHGPPPFEHKNASKFLKNDASHHAEATLEKNQEDLWEDLRRFYDDNEQAIERSLALDVRSMGKDEKASELDVAIDTFMETANVILGGLVALGNVHPVLGVAIFAFHGIIKLEIARRDNNRKVLAVKLQMQNMMCAMFQLRKLKHVHVQDRERDQERMRLQRLVAAIADEITQCGSDLNYYCGRKFVAKLVNSKTYERLFADHVETFAQRRAELQSTITSYIAAGIDAANIAIIEVGHKVQAMDGKINHIVSILRRLDTPREREVVKFIEQNGGERQCVEKDELLTKLLTKAGEVPVANGKGGASAVVVRGDELAEIREMLKAELGQNLKEVLAQNLTRFEKILKVQNNNLKRISDQMEEQGREMQEHTTSLDNLLRTSILILEEGKLIKKAIAPSLTVTLKDPVLQRIWDRMGLKGSVKAKHFVLTFRDHLFSDHSAPASLVGSPHAQAVPLSPLHEPSSLLLSPAYHTPQLGPDKLLPYTLLQSEIEDIWALRYVDVAHVQPIIEAMDEDGSGFISVKEANKFALSRPKGWSLMRWFAYWAAGWHINITNYRSKIYAIVQQMHDALLLAHPANRSYVDEYLNHSTLNRVEGLLRSTKPLPDSAHKESKLVEVAESMTVWQEQRLVTNLNEISFLMESPADVTLVAVGRVETWILPLLYLILNRHLDIIKLGQKRVLDGKELTLHVKSLTSIFAVFDERMNHLETIFRQIHRSVLAQFENFAYGMFLTSIVKAERNPSENTLLTFKDNETSVNKIMQTSQMEVDDISILTQGLGPTFEFEEVDINAEEAPDAHVPHPIEGVWTGQCIRANNKRIAFQGFFQCTINPITEKTITGVGETYLGEVEIEGNVTKEDEKVNNGRIAVELRIYSEIYADLWCKGEYDPDTEVIKGQWVIDDDSDEFPPADDEEAEREMDFQLPCGQFYITRTPAAVFRFRHLLDGPSLDPSWTLARKRWAFATNAVRYQTQDRIGSADFFRARTAERRRWIELTIRRELDKTLSSTKEQLSGQGKQDLWTLRLQMHPTNGRLYDLLSMYLFKRMTYNVGLYNCKSCDRRITFGRFQCITCMDENMSNQLDLCGDCIHAPTLPIDVEFIHDVSHSLIRSTHRIHDCELASMIPQARLRSERIKATFKAVEATLKPAKGVDDECGGQPKALTSPFHCACCGHEVTLPCWVCVACALDTFICLDCDHNRRPVRKREGFSAAHSYDHPLLRFSDSVEVKPHKGKASRLEKQLGEMETRINGNLTSLHEKVNDQLENVKMEMRTAVEVAVSKISARPIAVADLGSAYHYIDVNAESVAKASRSGTPTPSHPRVVVDVPFEEVRAVQDDRIAALEATLERRLQALEAKVDSQFGTILSLMRQLVPIASGTVPAMTKRNGSSQLASPPVTPNHPSRQIARDFGNKPIRPLKYDDDGDSPN